MNVAVPFSATPRDPLQHNLDLVITLLEKHKVVEALVHKQESPRQVLVEQLVHRQNLNELRHHLERLHPADVAHILEALPLHDRLIVWDLVKSEQDGEILLEVSDAVRETLLADMAPQEIVAAAEELDAEEIAELAHDLPAEVVNAIVTRLDERERAQLQAALTYEDDQVGAIMDFDAVRIRSDVRLEVVLRYLRRFDELPHQTDKLFVVDDDGLLLGALPLESLLLGDPDAEVSAVMARELVTFQPADDADAAAQAFERYDLVSAPVVNGRGLLLGRLTVNTMIDRVRQESEAETFSLAGLNEGEDLFGPVWRSARNRWPWLALNIITAFIASRVIDAFEGSIVQLVALAALMPIVSGIGGNAGTQTATLVIRGLALGQIASARVAALVFKELGIALINGLLWGSVLGLVAYGLYQHLGLGLVMAGAMTLNLLLAASVGLTVPLVMDKLGRDPAYGSSVILTAVTDAMGFFIFLGLASLFLF